METLSTTIKFIAAQASEASDNANAVGSTGDFGFIIVAVIVLLAGISTCAAVAFHHKKITAGTYFSEEYSSELHNTHNLARMLLVPIIAIVTCLLALSVVYFGTEQTKALAEENAALTSDAVVGSVDMQTGNVAFGQSTVKNSTKIAQSVQKFVLQNVEGVDVGGVTWKITINDIVVFNNKIGETYNFEPFNIEAESSVALKVEATGLSSDLAKSLIGKDVAAGTTSYQESHSYYTGIVKAIDSPGASAMEKDGIKVRFTPTDANIQPVEATTTSGGKYTLTGIEAGTPGKLCVVCGPDNTDYSAETINIPAGTKSILDIITTLKLTSLQVTIKDGVTSTGLTERTTCWCPVISSPMSNTVIKFYNYDRDIMNAGADNAYSMPEIASSTKETASAGEAYKSQANYFAFCTTGVTLDCFQTVDMPYIETFVDEEIEVATDLHMDKIKDRVSSINNSFRTVYRDELLNWDKEWRDDVKTSSTAVPHCLGYQYIRASLNGSKDNLLDIYGNVTGYGGTFKEESKILSNRSCFPWAARAEKEMPYGFCWFIDPNHPAGKPGEWSSSFTVNFDNGIVIQQTF